MKNIVDKILSRLNAIAKDKCQHFALGAVIAAWRVATAEEKTQHETINIYAVQ